MFKKVTLHTDRLDEVKGFYEYQLGLRIVEEDDASFTLAIGESRLVFVESARPAVYHFAFNIPGNQFSLAKGWAASRVTLNRQEGMDEIYYANFDADAFYFQDPAGNIVEFIGRRNVDRMGNFTVDSLLNISEVSITTPFVQEVGEQLEDMEIPVRGNKGIEPKALNFLGQGDAFLLLVEPERVWYFSKQKSKVHPVSIELQDGRKIDITEEGHFQKAIASNPISDSLEEMDFSGTIVWKTADLWSAAKGFADRANERPNALDTRFSLASGSKIFTAVAVCQLVEEGKLAFDDVLSELLPELFPNFKVTIHQLLTHTSGIPDFIGEDAVNGFKELGRTHPVHSMESDIDFVPLFNNKRTLFNPGEKFHYNNAGFIALGLVVEKVAGTTFAEAVEQRIFAPAGMVNSGYFRLDRLPGQTAFGYIEDGEAWRTNQYAVPIQGGASSGAFVTASDMTLFWERLMDYTLLSENIVKMMLTRHATAGNGAYGYGVWITQQGEDAEQYFASGSEPGMSSYSAYYAASQSILTILSNKSKGTNGARELIEKNTMQ